MSLPILKQKKTSPITEKFAVFWNEKVISKPSMFNHKPRPRSCYLIPRCTVYQTDRKITMSLNFVLRRYRALLSLIIIKKTCRAGRICKLIPSCIALVRHHYEYLWTKSYNKVNASCNINELSYWDSKIKSKFLQNLTCDGTETFLNSNSKTPC